MQKNYTIFVLIFSLFVILTHEPYVSTQNSVAETPQIIEEPPVLLTEKEEIVNNVVDYEIVGPKYVIRNSLDGARKPIPKLTSDTIDGRLKQFMDSQCRAGHLIPLLDKYSNIYKVDKVFAACVSWAETHLGCANKTTHNLFNIGNSDSGATKEYSGAEAGIRSFFWHVVHGTYLGGHEIIGTMSNEGRSRLGLPSCNEEKNHRKKCFSTGFDPRDATKKGNWSSNVTNCMSAIFDKQIDENFIFRKI